MSKIIIDYEQCARVAEHIARSGGVPKDREDPMALSFPLAVAENAWCATVAICHQTTPINGSALQGTALGVHRRGWDYLLQKSISEANGDPMLFTTEWLQNVTGSDLIKLFHDDVEGNTLNTPDERAMLLRDLGSFLHSYGATSIRECYIASDGYIVRPDGVHLSGLMKTLKAYQDPVEKKFFYFLALMQNQGFWTYKDPEHLSSPVNYHEQRGHFRLGTVLITDTALLAKIHAKEEITPDEDIAIRFAVRGAIEHIAILLAITPTMAHYFFWNYFRNCCARDHVHCSECGSGCKLPERYRMGETRCMFAPVCKSATIPIKEMLIEPRLDNTIWQ